MASRFGITLPNDRRFELYYNKDQSKVEQVERLILDYWMDYILCNWISEHNEIKGSPESKVKRLLDRCGTLLLRDIPKENRNTITDYKFRMNGSRELNVSDCPPGVADMVEGGRVDLANLSEDEKIAYSLLLERVDASAGSYKNKEREAKKEQKRARQTTRFSRIADIEREHPGCICKGYRVDTDNEFDVCGIRYRVSPTCEKYSPRHTRYGDQYDMDRVLVFTCSDGRLVFADQDGYLVGDGQIEQLNG